MSVSDYYVGQPAGTCGCGRPLIRVRKNGEWAVSHEATGDIVRCEFVSSDDLEPVGA